jgi:hypothetical protein
MAKTIIKIRAFHKDRNQPKIFTQATWANLPTDKNGWTLVEHVEIDPSNNRIIKPGTEPANTPQLKKVTLETPAEVIKKTEDVVTEVKEPSPLPTTPKAKAKAKKK